MLVLVVRLRLFAVTLGVFMILSGSVLRVERMQGSSDGRVWDYWNAFVLDGVKVYRVRVGDGCPVPVVGEVLAWDVRVNAYKRRGDGGAELSITLLSVVDSVPVSASRGE